jgi:hypothetical protein
MIQATASQQEPLTKREKKERDREFIRNSTLLISCEARISVESFIYQRLD